MPRNFLLHPHTAELVAYSFDIILFYWVLFYIFVNTWKAGITPYLCSAPFKKD